MKSAVMALWFFAVSVGNLITSAIDFNKSTFNALGINLAGANHYAFFALFMLVALILYIFVARIYRGKTYIQGEEPTALAS
jgi:POT family proton-dependent oligopeptide transporter